MHVAYPKTAPTGPLSAWARALQSREHPELGVTDGLVYTKRRRAQALAAQYRLSLRERGVNTESVSRPSYAEMAWLLVLWHTGDPSCEASTVPRPETL